MLKTGLEATVRGRMEFCVVLIRPAKGLKDGVVGGCLRGGGRC